MKKCFASNRGATLIELITSIAILSIVGVSCFTLLMFSIRTNNFILTGTSACRDAEVLNERLELLFKDATVSFDDTVSDYISFDLDGDEIADLEWNDSKLEQGEEIVLQDNITNFSVEPIEGSALLRITYTIDNTYTCTKIFPCASYSADKSGKT